MSERTPANIVELRGVTKVFRDFWMRPRVVAVRDLSLSIHPGEVLGMLGPNGSGKSTTIKMVLGLLYPSGGRISVFGRHPGDVWVRRRIGYLPEETHLYPFLNAEETLDFYGCLFHLPRSERRRRTAMLLEMLGLSAARYRPIGEYSKGMQRRVGLAQALINDPDLLILDEPTTGMDPIATRQIKDLLLQLRSRGKTVILCTHLLLEVEDVCSRLLIMYGGRQRAAGTVDELLTVRDCQRIETDALTPQTIQKLEAVLGAEEGKGIRRIEQPRRRLESLFLDVVRDAEQEGLQTSGATSGGVLAPFLASESGQELLDRLVERPGPPSATAAGPVRVAVEVAPDAQLLAQFSSAADPPAPARIEAEPQTSTSTNSESRDPDHTLLSRLTRGGKGT